MSQTKPKSNGKILNNEMYLLHWYRNIRYLKQRPPYLVTIFQLFINQGHNNMQGQQTLRCLCIVPVFSIHLLFLLFLYSFTSLRHFNFYICTCSFFFVFVCYLFFGCFFVLFFHFFFSLLFTIK